MKILGWVDKEQADFMLVVFSKGGVDQYDCFLNFAYQTFVNKFELAKIEFENQLQLNGQKP